jgi:hypothetical protein
VRAELPVAFFVIASLAPSTAQAQWCGCSCPYYFQSTGVDSPAPLNPWIFEDLEGVNPATAQLMDVAIGIEIPIVLEPAGDAAGRAAWVHPTADLAPNSVYDLTFSSTYASGVRWIRIETGTERDTSPPTAEGLEVVTPAADPPTRLCHPIVGGELHYRRSSDESVVEIEILRATASIGRIFLEPSEQAYFGTDTDPEESCFRLNAIDGLVEGETLIARMRVWDRAGNASVPIEQSFVVAATAIEPVRSCSSGCSVTHVRHGPSAIGFLAFGLALVLRRRARN